jgi:hypothetical protein
LLRFSDRSLDFVTIGLMEVKMCDEINLEIEGPQKLLLLAEDVLSWDSLVSYLV